MKRQILSLKAVCILCLPILAACAGPKVMSAHQSQTHVWEAFDDGSAVSIQPLLEKGSADPEQSKQLKLDLASQLIKEQIFETAEVNDELNLYPKLLIEITNIKRAGWGPRAVRGVGSSVHAEGKLISSDESVIATISEQRSGPGGLLGAGGWLACGEESMINTLRKWVVEDICNNLKKPPKLEADK